MEYLWSLDETVVIRMALVVWAKFCDKRLAVLLGMVRAEVQGCFEPFTVWTARQVYYTIINQ